MGPEKISPARSPFIVRKMNRSDIGQCMVLSADEGWNQTERDWGRLVDNPHNDCLVAADGRMIVGTATAMNYKNQIAWIGMVLVDKDYRGQGISKMLLSALLKLLKSCRSVKLDATPAGQRVYEKMGFISEYIIYRLTTHSMDNLQPGQTGIIPQPVLQPDVSDVAKLDSVVFGTDRECLVKSLVKENTGKALMIKKDNAISAFLLGREGRKYQHIGPVSASSYHDAKALISSALANLAGQPVVLDVPADKDELIRWLSSMGFKVQRHFVRMYLQTNPYPGKKEEQFLICGPEFG